MQIETLGKIQKNSGTDISAFLTMLMQLTLFPY